VGKLDSIYLNNFRGISDSIIPIYQVNFLIGENSTGKSSVLNAIALLSSPEFWFNLNFNTREHEFGGYKDIVSVSSSDKSEFQMGIFKDDGKHKKSSCYMIHFKEGKNGLPVLSRFSQLCNEFVATVVLTDKSIKIFGTKKIPSCTSCFELKGCFDYLRRIPDLYRSGYKNISGDLKIFMKKNPISLFPIVVEKLFPEIVNEKKEEDYFEFPTLASNFASLAPIRTKPKRTYDGYAQKFSPEGEHTPYILRSKIWKKGDSSFKESLEKYGNDSGLYSSINISQFGNDKSAPFELLVNLSGNSSLRINSVGYGVSQVLPVIVELINRPKNTFFNVQQPEVHLHPKAQAALGDLFFSVAINKKNILCVETHSDYLVDRFRMNYRKHETDENFAQILFFKRDENGNVINTIKILEDGEYGDDQPPEFREFFLEEQRKILGF